MIENGEAVGEEVYLMKLTEISRPTPDFAIAVSEFLANFMVGSSLGRLNSSGSLTC